MNQERRPAMMQAQRRMREANRDLDMAIYRDSVNDEEFQARLKEFQSAQSELARLRFESELSVRKILTPEQLVRFRELRRRFAEAREGNMQDHRMRRDGEDPPPNRDVPQRRPPIND
jgi:Spy/CpxP family protein refolding chaperone